MKKVIIFLSLISFIVFLFGCESNNKQTIDSSVSTSTSSSEINKIKLSKEYLIGRWISTEEDWPMEIDIYKNNNTEQLQLDIISPEDSAGTYTTVSGYSSYYNDDNSISYSFSIDNNQLFMRMRHIQEHKQETKPEDITVGGIIRPWTLEKVEDS